MELKELIAFITKAYTECDLHRPAICIQIGDQIAPCEKVKVARNDDEDESLLIFVCSDKDRAYSCQEVLTDGDEQSSSDGV